jgi:hypothetical protein
MYQFVLDSPMELSYSLAAPQGVNGQKFFENLADSDQHPRQAGAGSAISQNNPEIREENGFDRSVIDRSNGSWMFVFNKTSMPGGGLAEGRRQRVVKNREIGSSPTSRVIGSPRQSTQNY